MSLRLRVTRTPTGTIMTIELEISSPKLLWLSMILNDFVDHNWRHWNDRRQDLQILRALWVLFQVHDQLWLTHWGRVTHICVGKLTIIDSDNGLSPGRRQAIIWTNNGILLIGSLGTNFNEISIGIQTFSFKKIHLKMSSAKWRPFFSRSQCVNVRANLVMTLLNSDDFS